MLFSCFSIVCASMIPISLFNCRFCDYFRILLHLRFSNVPLRVGRQKYSCVFLAMSAKRKLTKEKKRRKEKEKKNISFFSLFFCVSFPSNGNYAKPAAAPLHVFMIWLLISFFFYFFFRLDPNSVSSSQVSFVSLFSGSASSDPRGLFWERNYDDHDFTCFHSSFFLCFFNSHYPGFGFSPDSFLPDRFFDLLRPLGTILLQLYIFQYHGVNTF